MYELPTTITIEEQSFAIRNRGDFRMVLDCFKALTDTTLTEQERIIASLVIFFEDMEDVADLNTLPNVETAFKEMTRFFNCGNPDPEGSKKNYKVMDWEQDEMILMSAMNNVAHKEIRLEPYVHWWTFMGYYMAIGESTFATVVSIRNKLAKGVKLEKHENKFMKENPKYFSWDFRTEEQKAFDDELRKMWNG